MVTMTLFELSEDMKDHDREHAPGSESAQYQELCAWADSRWQVLPSYEEAGTIVVDEDDARFWLAVAERDYMTAARYGHVDADWIDEVAS